MSNRVTIATCVVSLLAITISVINLAYNAGRSAEMKARACEDAAKCREIAAKAESEFPDTKLRDMCFTPSWCR